ncbi:MAG: S8 family serine peptidase [Anaerolineales bacterium]|nr:S8 family serine peptidase [Anaerolineales bacterium]
MKIDFWKKHLSSWLPRVMLLSFMFLLMAFPFVSASSNDENDGKPIIEPELVKQINRDSRVGYMIFFEESPDLSAAYGMDWEERGEYVYETLQTAVDKSQKEVRDYLDKNGVDYQSFWIDNIIVVDESSRTVFNGLMEFSEIEALRARRIMGLIEPERVSDTNEILDVEANISHVGAPDVWDLGYTGEGIVVANIDTGVRYTHEALLPHYRGFLGGGTYDHDYNWWDPTGVYTTAPGDNNGHGSHTMGIMIGDDNSSNQIGMAPGAEWMACKGCTSTSCPDAYLLECAQFITAPTDLDGANPDSSKRPNIVNNSWGDCGTTVDYWYQDVVNAWQAAGIYPVFSNGNAGNCGYDVPPGLDTVGNPARYGNVTSVGSSGKSDGAYATHSNWGPTDDPDTINPRGYPYLKPQVIAPGVSIRSAYRYSDTSYAGMTGTSMSAPHVAGLIALMWDAAPCLIGDYANTETIIEQTATAIPYATGGTPPPGPGNVPNYATGWGEIDALAATQLAESYCGTLTGTVTESGGSQTIDDALISAAGVYKYSTNTALTGIYSLSVITGVYTVTTSHYGYYPEVITNVIIEGDVSQDISLDPAPPVIISGTVTDDTSDWPVYAKLTIDDYPGEPIWTNPTTGWYSVELPLGSDYTFTVNDFWESYNIEETSTGVLAGEMTLDFTLGISDSICTAPGYHKSIALDESFDNGVVPTGWTVVDNAGTGAIWTFDDPDSNSNLTGGTGLFADANSDTAGSIDMDTELRTPILNFTGYSDLSLNFNYDWYVYPSGGSEIADVDISLNGSSGPWTNLWRRTYAANDRGPKTADIDLSAYSGQSNVMLRFHYYNAYFDWWWQIDDVQISNPCERLMGGLVAGHVYDGDLSTPLNGAQISNEDQITTASVSTPEDDNVEDGFYTIASLDGTHTLTTTMTGYQPDIDLISVILSDTVAHDFTLYTPLTAEFSASPTSGEPPLTVTFTDASDGSISSWLWDFGDGITSTLQNPYHVFSDVGFYTVTLDISGPGGSDQEEKPDYITAAYAPVAGFSASPTMGIAPMTVTFTDTSTGTITSWLWDFGDNITSTLQNPSHLYTLDDIYSVSLLVTGPGGNDLEEKTDYITVYMTPTADFSASPTFGIAPMTVSFTDTSTGSVASWLWDFGDGITSTLQNPNHDFLLRGLYTITLDVFGPAGSDREIKANYIKTCCSVYIPFLIMHE